MTPNRRLEQRIATAFRRAAVIGATVVTVAMLAQGSARADVSVDSTRPHGDGVNGRIMWRSLVALFGVIEVRAAFARLPCRPVSCDNRKANGRLRQIIRCTSSSPGIRAGKEVRM